MSQEGYQVYPSSYNRPRYASQTSEGMGKAVPRRRPVAQQVVQVEEFETGPREQDAISFVSAMETEDAPAVESNDNSGTGYSRDLITFNDNGIGREDVPALESNDKSGTVYSREIITLNNNGIGWKTPLFILGSYVLAILAAAGHYLFFEYLDERTVVESLNQEYTSATSTAFITVFRAALKFCLGITFAQLLWHMFRKRYTKISTIDDLFTALDNPLALFSWDLITAMPVGFLLAITFWSIPVATVFPPGAITVVARELAGINSILVPSYNGSDVGFGRAADISTNPLFQSNVQFTVGKDTKMQISKRGPSITLDRLAKQVIIGQGLIPLESPCGSNCSYTIEFEGPIFKCSSVNTTNSSLLKAHQTAAKCFFITATSKGCALPIFQAGPNTSAADNNVYQLDLQFMIDNARKLETTVVSCIAYQGSYTMNYVYSNNVPTYKIRATTDSMPIDNRETDEELMIPYPFDPLKTKNESGVWDSQTLSTYSKMNSISIARALGGALSGNISIFGTASSSNDGTLLLDSLINTSNGPIFKTSDLKYNADPRIVEEMLQNLTASVITLRKSSTQTSVSQSETRQTYCFCRKTQLLAPYVSTLAVSLVFIALGLWAIVRDGVAANNGPIQIMTAFARSEAVRQHTVVGSLGGAGNVSDELKELKVRIGQWATGEWGFGTVEEIGVGKGGRGEEG